MKTENTISLIEEALFQLHPNVKPLYSTITILKGQSSLPVEKSDIIQKNNQVETRVLITAPVAKSNYSYNPDTSLQNRVLNIISELGRFAKAGEILDKIQEYEPNYAPKLSPAFTALKAKGLIKNYTLTGSHRDTMWGLAEWDAVVESKQD